MSRFGILHIPSGKLFVVNGEKYITKARTLEEFKQEFMICFTEYINKKFETEEKDSEYINSIILKIQDLFSITYISDPECENTGAFWLFDLINFIRDEEGIRPGENVVDTISGYDEEEAFCSWEQLKLEEFECVEI